MDPKKACHFLVAVKERGPFGVLVLRGGEGTTVYDSVELPERPPEPEDDENPRRPILWAVSRALQVLGLDPAEMARGGWAEPDIQVLSVREELSFDELRRHWQKSTNNHPLPPLTTNKVGDA
jgi:hypothetical protein